MQEQRQSSTQVQLVKRAMKPAQEKAIPTRYGALSRKSNVLVCGFVVSSLLCHVCLPTIMYPLLSNPFRGLSQEEKKSFP